MKKLLLILSIILLGSCKGPNEYTNPEEFYKEAQGCVVTGYSPETFLEHQTITVKTKENTFLVYAGEDLYYKVGDTIK